MSVLAQGTHVYFIDPNDGTPAVVEVTKATTFTPGGAPATQIDETTLADRLYMQYRAGLRDPGAASLGLNADPSITSHVTMHELSEESPPPVLKWAVGWSDGTALPKLGQEVGSVSVTAGGSSYTQNTTTVAFSAPDDSDGRNATGTATVTAGAVTSITITDAGTGYTSAPTVTITDSGSGTGATATATLGDDVFTTPTTRTWFLFDGYISDFPFDFSANTIVTTEATIQRTGASQWKKKA